MAFVAADRVFETTSNTGTTATYTLLGAIPGYQTFFTAIGASNTCYYSISNLSSPSEWEVGLGTIGSSSNPATITRTSVLSSSNNNSLVNFSSGTKNIFVTYPAKTAMFLDANNNYTIPNPTGIAVSTVNLPQYKPSLTLDFSNNETFDPRITFSRADGVNITGSATYYDGKTTALAEQNLLAYSQQFNISTWTAIAVGASIIDNNTIAPDSSSTAAILTCSGSSVHSIAQSGILTSGITYTVSVYAKAGTYNYFGIGSNNGLGNIVVNLSTGAIIAGSGAVTLIGNGWYRISCQLVPGGARGVFIGATDASGSSTFISAGTETFYIWGAQAEQRLSVTVYTSTTTSAISNYIPQLLTALPNTPRINHDPITGKCLGLLMEESRTNLIDYSQNFAYWSQNGMVWTANTVIAPDGTLTASMFISGSTLYRWLNVTAGTYYTFSFFVKPINPYLIVLFYTDSVAPIGRVYIVPATGMVINTGAYGLYPTAKSISVGNGWYRVSMTGTPSTSGVCAFHIYPINLYAFWGAQVETGRFMTSYIPTNGVALSRAGEIAFLKTDGWYNINKGTFFADFQGGRENTQVGYGRVISFGAAGAFNSTAILSTNGSTNGLSTWYGSTPINAVINNADYYDTGGKAAVTYNAETLTTYLIGNGQLSTNMITQVPLPENIGEIGIGGNLRNSSNMLNGHIRRIVYYSTNLPLSTLATLTEI